MAPSSLDSLPPFPSDLPLAPIARISLRKLLAGDAAEGARVLQATQTYGFFYLDMRDAPEGEQLLGWAEELLALAQVAFAAPIEDKERFKLEKGKSLFGYKPAGTVKRTDKDARPDLTEFLNISKDHLHGVAPSRTYPAAVQEASPLLREFTRAGHTCGMLVLRTLAQQLKLDHQAAFTDLNMFDRPSGDHCRLTHTTPHSADANAIGLPSHTDFGSVTILFNWLGGLQIESRTAGSEGQWEWVQPLAGHAVVNLGDAMVIFTNGALKSAKHRVVPAPGAQAGRDRYSVVYFVRPHNAALMKPVAGFDTGTQVHVGGKFSVQHVEHREALSAGEWMIQRAVQLGN